MVNCPGMIAEGVGVGVALVGFSAALKPWDGGVAPNFSTSSRPPSI